MTRGTLKAWIDALRSASTAAEGGAVDPTLAESFERWARPLFPGAEVFNRIEGRPDGWEYNGDKVQEAWAVWQACAKAFAPAGSGEAVAGSGEVKGWATHHDEPMLFPTRDEAVAYCDDDEEPIPLYAGAAPAVDAEALHTLIAEWRDPEGWTDATRYLSLNEWKFGRPARKQCADELESIITGADHGR
jgi:hypothetical protein